MFVFHVKHKKEDFMSLDWNAKGITGWEALFEDENEKTRLAYFCWELMRIGVSRVTEKNAKNTWERIEIAQKLEGTILTKNENGAIVPCPYTEEDVKKYIGYSTNVTNKTNAQFAKSMVTDRL